MGLLREFQKFAIKGNVVDMAVGVIIGGAFGKIVSSLVNDLVMPVLGTFTGRGGYGDQLPWLGGGEKPAAIEAAQEIGGADIAWSRFCKPARLSQYCLGRLPPGAIRGPSAGFDRGGQARRPACFFSGRHQTPPRDPRRAAAVGSLTPNFRLLSREGASIHQLI